MRKIMILGVTALSIVALTFTSASARPGQRAPAANTATTTQTTITAAWPECTTATFNAPAPTFNTTTNTAPEVAGNVTFSGCNAAMAKSAMTAEFWITGATDNVTRLMRNADNSIQLPYSIRIRVNNDITALDVVVGNCSGQGNIAPGCFGNSAEFPNGTIAGGHTLISQFDEAEAINRLSGLAPEATVTLQDTLALVVWY